MGAAGECAERDPDEPRLCRPWVRARLAEGERLVSYQLVAAEDNCQAVLFRVVLRGGRRPAEDWVLPLAPGEATVAIRPPRRLAAVRSLTVQGGPDPAFDGRFDPACGGQLPRWAAELRVTDLVEDGGERP